MEYNKITPEILEQLKAAAPGHILTGEDVNLDYGRDEMPIYGESMPEAVLQATSTEEIAAVVKICNENKIPVTTRGAATGLAGGCVPVYGGIVIETIKMNKILSYDLENFSVTIEPGVLLKQLAEDALTKGLMYPPDPGEKLATVGGNVSTNAGGMRAVKYGCTRDYVLAMKVVLPTGEITSFGAKVSKTSSGYSLLHLMIGSEGTLGIITELTLKLIPAPKMTLSLIVPFEDLETAISTVPKVKMAKMDPQALEFMEREIILASERYVGREVFPKNVNGVDVGAYLMITLDDQDEDMLLTRTEKLAEMLRAKGVKVAVSDLARDDMPETVEDAFRYDRLVLATTTYNNGIFPFMHTFIEHLTEREYQNRTIAFIENGTWAPVAAKLMKAMFEKSKKITFAENTVTIKSALNADSEAALEKLAEELAG